jgi:hypothetical protein
MNSDEDVSPAQQDEAVTSQNLTDTAKVEPTERPQVEAYDPHFGRQAMAKDSFWRL